MTLDEHYICQRAANAIISEIGPFRVSTDALQAINQFLDEFIVLLLTCSLSLDLSEIKSVVFSLLPSTLGKNAIVEAELEVKTFTETESIDYDLYERMRSLGENDSFPLDEAVPLLREKCFEYCTLADKDDQLYLQKSIRHKRNETNMKVIISPIVAIYVTTVMEHIAEYLLTAVAMTAEHEDTDYVRVKEVFLALIDDIQLGDVFHRMDLREKMEKRAGYNSTLNRYRASYLPPTAPNQTRKSYLPDPQQSNETGSFLDIAFDDLDLDYFDDNNPRKSTISTGSRIPEIARPQSAMSYASNNTYSNNTSSNNNRKSTFHLFKNNRNSFSGEIPRADSPHGASGAAYDPDASPATNMNFDDLIKSGGTMKVSLTPNRLRSIEIKDQTKDELSPPPLTWERRSTSSPRLSAVNATRPSSPLVRQNTSSSNNTAGAKKPQSMPRFSSSSTSLPTSNSNHDMLADASINEKPKKMSIEVPKINARPQTPTSPLSKKSFIVNEASKFENPREAPPPPASTSSSILELPPLTIPIATPVKRTTATISTPMVKSNSQTKLVSPSTSTPSIAAATAAAVTASPIKKTPTPSTKLPSAASPKTPTPLTKLSSSPKATYVKSSLPSSTHTSSGSSDSLSSDISSMANMPSPIISTAPSVKSIQEPPLPRPTKSSTTINTNGMILRRSSVSSKKSRENLRKLKEEQELQQQQQQQQQQQEQAVDEPMPLSAVAVVEEEKKKFNQDLDKANVEVTPVVVTDEPQQLDDKQEQDTSITNRQVRFDNSNEDLAKTDSTPTNIKDTNEQPPTVVPRIKKAPTLSPERPSSMVAKRASMVGNHRRRSLHESYATEKHHQDIILRQRVSNVGSVSVSIKQWDDILKTEEPQQASVIPPAAHRRSVLRQLRQQQMQEQQQDDNSSSATNTHANTNSNTTTTTNNNNNTTSVTTSNNNNNNNNNAVLDKVLKFERASSLDNVAHQRVSHMPRRERFLYLQQDPSAIERKSSVLTAGPKKTLPVPVHRAVGIDQGVQTDYPEKEEKSNKSSIQSSTDNTDNSSDDEEHGLVDGDEEWFLQDDEWDEQEETAIVEWLLGE